MCDLIGRKHPPVPFDDLLKQVLLLVAGGGICPAIGFPGLSARKYAVGLHNIGGSFGGGRAGMEQGADFVTLGLVHICQGSIQSFSAPCGDVRMVGQPVDLFDLVFCSWFATLRDRPPQQTLENPPYKDLYGSFSPKQGQVGFRCHHVDNEEATIKYVRVREI